ncbi:MAG: 8-amino-7-oxononanoate synthase [Chlamydiae bacterium]|nr:8-amino-7-oxononanoate synthase [Chlamydiota bacterium]MBI3265988.1 8-amino-7-oxononanoate synthase [Chlamydiota bacterium]
MQILEFEEEIKTLKDKNRYRSLRKVTQNKGPLISMGSKAYINFSSNNYLGLAQDIRVKWAAVRATLKYGSGSGASRLISGNTSLHESLEEAISKWKGTEGALVYPTGYMANLGAISALMNSDDLIVLDRLNHASIVEACRVAQSKLWVYPHQDMNRLEEILKNGSDKNFRKKWVITETLFSMDGDIAPLPLLLALCERHGAHLMIDEAHATGVLGEKGRGALEYFGLDPNRVAVIMGTFSKALGSLGGFIAGKESLIDYLRNQSKSFIYTTALPAGACAASLKAIQILEKNSDKVKSLRKNVEYFYKGLNHIGLKMPEDQTPIYPWIVGGDEETLRASEVLMKGGVYAPAIRPPTVPEGEGRIRFSLMANHTNKHLDRVLKVLNFAKQNSEFRIQNSE